MATDLRTNQHSPADGGCVDCCRSQTHHSLPLLMLSTVTVIAAFATGYYLGIQRDPLWQLSHSGAEREEAAVSGGSGQLRGEEPVYFKPAGSPAPALTLAVTGAGIGFDRPDRDHHPEQSPPGADRNLPQRLALAHPAQDHDPELNWPEVRGEVDESRPEPPPVMADLDHVERAESLPAASDPQADTLPAGDEAEPGEAQPPPSAERVSAIDATDSDRMPEVATPAWPEPAPAAVVRHRLFSVQLGSFKEWENAAGAVARWSERGFDAFIHLSTGRRGDAWYTVRIGRFSSRDDADAMQRSMATHERVSAVVVPLDPDGGVAGGVGGPQPGRE